MNIIAKLSVTSMVKTACVLLLVLMTFAIAVPANAFPVTHTVTFFENTSGTDSVVTFETGTATQALTLFVNLSPNFSNEGFTFNGWNTSADGSSVAYSDGSSYSFNADIGLYAQWVAIPVVHTVTFYENTSESDPVATLETGTASQALTLFVSLSPNFSNEGFTFNGWNTSADGSGVAYSDGSSYSFNADIGLYAQWVAIPVVHTVTFYENTSGSDPVATFETGTASQALTLFDNLSPSFSNDGFTFDGWNTAANGSGTAFTNGSGYAFGADIGLYAQWVAIPVVHTVTFYENASGSDVITTSLSASLPTALTSFANLDPSFANSGHSFIGWNTVANGSGTAYTNGSIYAFGADIGLYAQWVAIPVVHTVTFYENASGSDAVTTNLSASVPTGLTSFANLDPSFVNPGHSFTGWNTAVNGSGVSYADGSQYTFASNVVLYAQWSSSTLFHTVTFNENDSATDSVNYEMSESTVTPLTLFSDLQPTFVNASHTFSSWNTNRDGSGTTYSDGAQFAFDSDLVLYAQWNTNNVDTFSFNANGGSGSVASINGSPGSLITVPGQSGMIRAGFVLTNWNTSANGSGTRFVIGSHVTMLASTRLYAQWSGHKIATLFGAIGTFKAGSSILSAALKSQINRVANTIRSRKYLKVNLFGYTAATGLKSLDVSLSRARARNVASYLRSRLQHLKVRGVTILSTGEGAITGQSSNAYSRVEVFGV